MRAGRIIALVLTASISWIGSGNAHGIWVAERHGDMAIVYGHGSSDEAYDTAKLKRLTGAAADGSESVLKISARDDHVLFAPSESTVVVYGEFDNGFWSEGPDGKWVNKPKDEVSAAKRSAHYVKYTTGILRPLTGPQAAKGFPLEIVALADPIGIKAGDKLPVQVLAEGKPVAGVDVIAEYTTDSEGIKVTTDAEGKAAITIRNQGLNVIAASWSVPTPDSDKADEIGYFATLSFNLHHHGD
jgi:nickel transport protein